MVICSHCALTLKGRAWQHSRVALSCWESSPVTGGLGELMVRSMVAQCCSVSVFIARLELPQNLATENKKHLLHHPVSVGQNLGMT